ncbi:hypothetical protein H4Q32_018672 [Labeo rohita]|uniref:Uncharacterized protein n=1 Tax=Labeo rohita TaxID=84645 RepID=A0ABQ8LCV7_LABRO|nr:hypothetical protein H4Q32_018672 [Labeo rohita]
MLISALTRILKKTLIIGSRLAPPALGPFWILASSSPPSPVGPPPPGSLVPPTLPWSVIVPPSPQDSTPLAAPRRSVPLAALGSSLQLHLSPLSLQLHPGSLPPPQSPEPWTLPWPSGYLVSPRLIWLSIDALGSTSTCSTVSRPPGVVSPSSIMAPPSIGSAMGCHHDCSLGLVWFLLLRVPSLSTLAPSSI